MRDSHKKALSATPLFLASESRPSITWLPFHRSYRFFFCTPFLLPRELAGPFRLKLNEIIVGPRVLRVVFLLSEGEIGR